MMPALQYLRHGKALCGKVFKRFVETFNYHNDFIANLMGDGDLPTSDGCIKLDRTDPTHPVIRLNKNNLALPRSSGGNGGLPGRFAIKTIVANEIQEGSEEEQTYTVTFENPYYDIGGKTYDMQQSEEGEEEEGEEEDQQGVSISNVKDGDIIILKLNAGESRGEELATVGSIQELQQIQDDVAFFSIPLYKVSGGLVVCDFRTGPIASMGEF